MIDIENLSKQTEKLTLLYVEDDKESISSLKLLLEDIFSNIVVAINGEDGLEKFKNNNIDLVITDINMPIVNGLDMSKMIKKINNKTPIILLTAMTELSALQKAIDIGIDGFINKPLVDIDILYNKIDIVVKNILFDKNQKEHEKTILVSKILHNISHHWKQPLSVISIISSALEFKFTNNIPLTNKDFSQLNKITQTIQELSDLLGKIDNINFDSIDNKEVERFMKISNLVYEDI